VRRKLGCCCCAIHTSLSTLTHGCGRSSAASSSSSSGGTWRFPLLFVATDFAIPAFGCPNAEEIRSSGFAQDTRDWQKQRLCSSMGSLPCPLGVAFQQRNLPGRIFLIVSFRNVICRVGFLDNFLSIISFIIPVLFFLGGNFLM